MGRNISGISWGSGYANPDMPPEVARALAERGFAPDGSRLPTQARLDAINATISDDWQRMGFQAPQAVADPRAQYAGDNTDIFQGANSPFADPGYMPTSQPAFGTDTRAALAANDRQIDADTARVNALADAIMNADTRPPQEPRNAGGGMSYTPGLPEEQQTEAAAVIPASGAISGIRAPKPVPRPLMVGNIDLTTRPQVRNDDGSISTVRSMSYGLDDGREVLIPTVSDEGTIMADEEAAQYWGNKGQHLGVFSSPYAADEYAQHLHDSQARMLEAPDLGSVVPIPHARPQPAEYVIQAGDNPTTIARALGVSLADLERKNPGLLKKARRLKIGARIKV